MKRSILIVDDEFGLAELVADILVDHGYEATVAVNGRQGLSCLTEKSIDLVIADLMMPVMSGPELLVKMRSTPELAGIPVVAMTTIARELPKQGDFQAVLQKPFTSEELLGTVAGVLSPVPGTSATAR